MTFSGGGCNVLMSKVDIGHPVQRFGWAPMVMKHANGKLLGLQQESCTIVQF